MDGGQVLLNLDYCEAVEAAGGIPLLLPPVGKAESYATLVQGIIIPGGQDLDPHYYREEARYGILPVSRIRSDFEMSLINSAVRLNKPLLGICYGMQLLNVFFGGSLYQDIDAELPMAINHKSAYHKVVIAENSFLTPGTFSVNSSHHQAVRTVGNGLSAIAHAEDQLIEAICREDYPFLVGIQWHPEREHTNEFAHSIFRRFVEASRQIKRTSIDEEGK